MQLTRDLGNGGSHGGLTEVEARARHQEVINHANRRLCGSAYRRGIHSGLEMLDKLRCGRFKARSPETNLDLEQIAVHASRAVVQTLFFNGIALGVFVLQVLLMMSLMAMTMVSGAVEASFGSFLLLTLAVLILGLIGSSLVAYERVYLRWANARRFLKREYAQAPPSSEDEEEEGGAYTKKMRALSSWLQGRLLQVDPSQNVVTFEGYAPFLGAGGKVSGWVLTVERKPDRMAREEASDGERRIHIPVEEFYRAADEAVAEARLPGLQRASLLYVKGAELEVDGEILTRPTSRPVSTLPEERLWELGQGDLERPMRFYRLYRYIDRSRDMVLSYYLRFYNVGAVTFIEGSTHMLTSVDQNRFNLAPVLNDTRLSRGLKTAGLALVLLPYGLYGLVALSHLTVFLMKLFKWFVRDARQRRAISSREQYNYGVSVTFRESVSAPFYQDYYGVQDLTMYWRSIEDAVIDGMVELLERHGVDVSQFEKQATTIINSGIMMSGGRFTASQVATGAGASIIESRGVDKSQQGLMRRMTQAGGNQPARGT